VGVATINKAGNASSSVETSTLVSVVMRGPVLKIYLQEEPCWERPLKSIRYRPARDVMNAR
jgi:hypothetical protein